MNRSSLSLCVATVASGTLFAISVLPISAMILGCWMTVVFVTMDKMGGPNWTRCRLGEIHVLIFATIAFLAHLAPVKTSESHFDARIRLPSAELTIAGLVRIADEGGECDLPVHLSFGTMEETDLRTVLFGGTDISLREFIETIEAQTSLKHRFVQCGNSYTILWGYPPSYLLGFGDQDLDP